MFWKSISSHTHAFLFLIFNALRYVFKKLGFFVLKSCFFQNFNSSNLIFDQSKSFWKILVSLCLVRLIEPVFQSIKIAIKNFSESLSVSIDRNYFSINRISWISFFLNSVFNPFKTLFQKFFQLFSLSPTRQSKIIQFLSFSSESFARFSSPKAGKDRKSVV